MKCTYLKSETANVGGEIRTFFVCAYPKKIVITKHSCSGFDSAE